MSTRDALLKKVSAAAASNGGKPLGSRRFFREYGLSPKDLWDAGFESYGAACAAIDLAPNELKRRITDDELLRPVALLARKLGKFPPKGAIEVERARTPSFPSWESYVRRKKEGPQKTLVEILLA